MGKRRAEVGTESIFVLRLYETFEGKEHLIEIRRFNAQVSEKYVEEIGKKYEEFKDGPYDFLDLRRSRPEGVGTSTPDRLAQSKPQEDG